MHDHEVRTRLQSTLADGSLDRTERDGLRAWLEAAAPDGARRAVYQSMAFDLARDALGRGTLASHSILNWLERVVKILTPLAGPGSATPGPAPAAEAWFSPDDDCAARIVRLIGQARQSLDICVFTITDDRITDALVSAHRRGVRVRVITDNDKRLDPGSDTERLESAGIPVRLDRTAFHMHHKFALVDGVVLLTGSYNWTRSAARDNEENFVLTPDPALIRSFRGVFARLWDRFAATEA